MKRFKKFLTEAEAPPVVFGDGVTVIIPPRDPGSIPPGYPGTEQHGPPSPINPINPIPPTNPVLPRRPSGYERAFEEFRQQMRQALPAAPDKVIDVVRIMIEQGRSWQDILQFLMQHGNWGAQLPFSLMELLMRLIYEYNRQRK